MRIATKKQLKEEYNNTGYIYIAQCNDFQNIYKVGFTVSINKRMDSLKIEYNTNNEFKCLNHYRSKNAKNLEKLIHKKLKDFLFEMRNPTTGWNSREFFTCNLEYIQEIILELLEENNKIRNYIDDRYQAVWTQLEAR